MSFFFFKQKTAYELRISDWSSDVCSSDLRSGRAVPRGGTAGDEPLAEWRALAAHSRTHMRQWPGARGGRVASRTDDRRGVAAFRARTRWFRSCCVQKKEAHRDLTPAAAAMNRSEEHTSELQSLMRISYAV